jgi:hypothetical protein
MDAISTLFSLFIVVLMAIIAGGVVRFLYALNLVRIKWYWMMIASWIFYQFCLLFLALAIIVRWLILGLSITVTLNNFDYGFYLIQLIVYCMAFCLTLVKSEETQTS